MHRLNAYTSASEDGGVSVDVEGIFVDLITVYKAAGYTEEQFHAFAKEVWKEVKVKISPQERDIN